MSSYKLKVLGHIVSFSSDFDTTLEALDSLRQLNGVVCFLQ